MPGIDLNFALKIALIAVVFIMAIALLGWLTEFLKVLLKTDLLSIASPIGLLGIFLLLIIGGFYLFNIGTRITKGIMR